MGAARRTAEESPLLGQWILPFLLLAREENDGPSNGKLPAAANSARITWSDLRDGGIIAFKSVLITIQELL